VTQKNTNTHRQWYAHTDKHGRWRWTLCWVS